MPSSDSLVARKIRETAARLSPAEMRVAQAVLDLGERVVERSLTELAEAAGVGEATVLRFCRRLGFSGYQEFRLGVARELPPAEQGEQPQEEQWRSELQRHYQGVLADTLSSLVWPQLREVAGRIRRARQVHFFGAGLSGITALDAAYKLVRIGIACMATPDPHLAAMRVATTGPEDVVVGLSVSGATRTTVQVLETAYRQGAFTVAITSFARSPVTPWARVVLLTSVRNGPLQGGGLEGKFSQLVVVDALTLALQAEDPEATARHREATARSVTPFAY